MTPQESAWTRRSKAFALLVLAAALLLAGAGNRIVDGFGGLTDPNTLASLSLALSGVPSEAMPVTFLDVDDRAREAWDARTRIPHQALASLISVAAQNGAAAIILDVDLAGEARGEQADPALNALLAGYPADAPALMLARRIVFSSDAESNVAARSSVATPYDDAVRGKSNIFWITTLNDIGRDRSVRRIRLWQSICGTGSAAAYPSALLVAGALFFSPKDDGFSLEQFLAARAAADCAAARPPTAPWPGAASAAVTIPYVIPDRANARALFRIKRNGEETIVLRRIPAAQIVSIDASGARLSGEIDSEPFRGRVVMIGASDAASGDLYNTPLGTMPGVLVIANGVVQTERILNAAAMPAWVRGSVIVLAFVAFAYMVRRLQGVVAALLISAVSFGLLYAIARLFSLADGIAVVAAALTGLALFKLLESLVGLAFSMRTLGWRAILKK